MILVAGLALAGLAGIAAAFYFSMRPGGSRARGRTSTPSSGPARAAGSSRSPRLARSGSGRTGSSTVIDFTGPQQALTDAEPPATGRRAAARRTEEPDYEDPVQGSRARRRTVWRKGSDVDEELWPVAAFGGVSDEQFWDDLAADKPLATTARTAQPAEGTRPRPPRRGPLPDIRPGDGRGRRAAPEGPTTNPQPRLAPGDRTAVQPAAASGTSPIATQPISVTQPVNVTQPVQARQRPRPAPAADEDPLTSPAYSLRPKGRVDGRSYQTPGQTRDPGRDQYERPSRGVGRSDPLRPGDAYGGTGGYPVYPDPQRSYGGAPQPMSARAYGDRYGYGNPAGSRGPADQGGPAGDPRLTNGGWNPARAAGPGADGNRGSRPAYPPVNGRRGPYGPQGHDGRLSLR